MTGRQCCGGSLGAHLDMQEQVMLKTPQRYNWSGSKHSINMFIISQGLPIIIESI